MGERHIPSTDERDPLLTPNDGIAHDPDWGWSLNYGHYGSRDDEGFPIYGADRRTFTATFAVELCGHGATGRSIAEAIWARRHEIAAVVATHVRLRHGVPSARLAVQIHPDGSCQISEYDQRAWSATLSA
jgi:hypothetical protein